MGVIFWTVLRPLLKKDEAAYLRLMGRFVESLKAPFPQRLTAFNMDAEVQALPRYCILTRMVIPALGRVVAEDAAHQARVDVTRLGLAARVFKAKRGAYPKQLGELRELGGEHLAKLPVDPFSGQPYRYVVKGDGFVLYSLGRNRVDDGGVENVKNPEKSDIVFDVTK